MKPWYDGLLELRKGEVVKITKGRIEPWQGHDLRVHVLDVVTTGRHYTSWFSCPPLTKPITGRVVWSEVRGESSGSSTTFFEIEEGNYDNYVFVKAGEIKKGQEVLKEILRFRTYQYVKIYDPYISERTIKLISIVPKSISILILTQNITDLEAIKKAADKLQNMITIRKGDKLHDRFILTTCEGWHIGHSLKDFGTKSSLLTKLESTVEAENDFDEKWNQSKTIYKKE